METVLGYAAVLGVLFGLVRYGWDFLRWRAEEYLVTTRRVIQTKGIINKRTTDSSLEKVNDVVLVQSFFGRILGYGDLRIVTGSDVGVYALTRIRKPIAFKTAMLDQKAKLGGEYGARMAEVPAEVERRLAEVIKDRDERISALQHEYAARLAEERQEYGRREQALRNDLETRLTEVQRALANREAGFDTVRRRYDVYVRNHPDDLAAIKGIGPKTEWLLRKAGVNSFTQLAEAIPEDILSILNAPKWRRIDPESWIKQAATLAKYYGEKE